MSTPSRSWASKICATCGVWRCDNCGWKRQNASRFIESSHECFQCGSTRGTMLPVSHTSWRADEHAMIYHTLIKAGVTVTYPLEDSDA